MVRPTGRSRCRSLLAAIPTALLLITSACGNTDGPETKDPDDNSAESSSDTGTPSGGTADTGTESGPAPPGVPSDIETTVEDAPPTVGTPLSINCQLLDQNGDPISPPSEPELEHIRTPDEKFERNDADELVPIETGRAQVACVAPSLSLVDDSPEQIDIAAGPPHTVRTSLSENKVEAGTTVTATCDAFDEHDNRIEDVDPDIAVDAMGNGIEIQGREITIEPADIYLVTCQLSGAKHEIAAPLEVNPGPPSSLSMTPVPSKSVYRTGEVVRFSTIVNDDFGNQVREARIDYSVSPSATSFGRGRWEFNDDGEYTVTATVTSPTKDGMNLSESATIVVSGSGPDIECRDPSNGEMVDDRPGTSVTFRGSVDDSNGVDSLTVNGQTVSAQSNGNFSTSISTDFGINFVDIRATDDLGSTSSRTCAFLLADDWSDEDGYLTDAVALSLEQDALDDGFHYALNSVADLFDRILNSNQLEVDLDNRLWRDTDGDGENDYWLKDSCDADTLFGCAHHSKVKYIRDPKSGPPGSGITSTNNSVSLDWVSGGIDISTTLNDVGIRLEVDSSSCNTKGWMRVSEIDIDLTTDVSLSNGQLSASLRGSPSVTSGTVNPDFGGACGTLADYLQGILQDILQDTVESEVEKAIENNVPPLLDDLVSSLDVTSISRSFSIDEFDGSGSVDLNFNARMSSLDIDSSRALIGAGTKFTPAFTRNATPSKGLPMPPGRIHRDPYTSRDAAAAIHVGVLNHVLYALWRGGLFAADVDLSTLVGSAPSGASAKLTTNLPPVATVESGGDVVVKLGGANIQLEYPDIFDQPVQVDVGAIVRTGASLNSGDSLDFDNVRVDQLYFSPRGVSIDANSRSTIESFLQSLVQGVVDRAVNKGLRSFPIPSFEITPTMGQYDLPTGDELGLIRGSIDNSNNHFVVEGDFGTK